MKKNDFLFFVSLSIIIMSGIPKLKTQRGNMSLYIDGIDQLNQPAGSNLGQSISEKYLCDRNRQLEDVAIDRQVKISNLEEQNRELEEEQDKQDNSTRYLRLLCKNLSQVEKHASQLQYEYKMFLDHVIRSNKWFNSNYSHIRIMINGSLIVLLIFTALYLLDFLLTFSLMSLVQSVLFVMPVIVLTSIKIKWDTFRMKCATNNINYDKSDEARQVKLREIKEIKDSKDYLEEYIDNV